MASPLSVRCPICSALPLVACYTPGDYGNTHPARELKAEGKTPLDPPEGDRGQDPSSA